MVDNGALGAVIAASIIFVCCCIPCIMLCCCYCCAPRRFFKLATWRAASLARVQEKFVDAGGFHWCYYEGGLKNKGERPTVLFLHGFSADKGYTLGLLRHITPHFHVIAPDLPGHGQTRPISAGVIEAELSYQVPDQLERLNSFIQAVLPPNTPFDLGGISMGGFIAGVYTARYPTNVRTLTLFCPAGIDGPNPSPFVRAITTFEVKTDSEGKRVESKNWLLPKSPEDVERLTGRIFYSQPWVPFRYYVAVSEDKMERKDIICKVMEDMLTPPYHLLLQDSLPHLHLPVLVAWGENDEILDVSCIEVIRDRVPGPKTIKTYPQTGHALIVERAAEVGILYRDWLYSHTRVPGPESSTTPLLSSRRDGHYQEHATVSVSTATETEPQTPSVGTGLMAATTVPAPHPPKA